ncbi:MAG: hypothetical protein RQ899_08290 [Pseudomonadales bacterium]|nr:hypothetical protein [Pseudomonadales bacterium]
MLNTRLSRLTQVMAARCSIGVQLSGSVDQYRKRILLAGRRAALGIVKAGSGQGHAGGTRPKRSHNR